LLIWFVASVTGAGLRTDRLADGQVCDSEICGLPVAARHFMDDSDSFFVVAFAHEELGRLKDGEEDEAEEEHDQRHAAHDLTLVR